MHALRHLARIVNQIAPQRAGKRNFGGWHVTDFRHPDGGYVFVITYGRSGSTLLQNLLNAIPGYQIRGENNNALLGLFQSWRALADSPDIARMQREGIVSDAMHPWFGAEAIDACAYRAALCRSFAQHILRPDPDTRVSGFKEIRTLADPVIFREFLDFVQTGFPKARIIFNTRNAAAVCRSSWWRGHDPVAVTAMITSADAVFRAHAAAHPDRCVLLRHEDYVADHAALDPLFTLLGDRPPPALLRAVMATRLTHAT
jgi:hypothetical protein